MFNSLKEGQHQGDVQRVAVTLKCTSHTGTYRYPAVGLPILMVCTTIFFGGDAKNLAPMEEEH